MKVSELKWWLSSLGEDDQVYLDNGCLTCSEAEGDLEIEALPPPKPPEDKLYDRPGMPLHWLARVNGNMWLVPAIQNGWAHRQAYRGYNPETAGFKEVSLKYALGCGIPWKS